MSAKVSNDFSPPIRKGSCRLSSCVIVCLHCVIANRRSVMSCRRLPTRLMIASHSCAWQRLSQHSLLACAARRKRLVSLNARKSCDSWLKTFWLARISSPFVTAFRSLQVCPKTEDPTAQTAKITFCVSGVTAALLANMPSKDMKRARRGSLRRARQIQGLIRRQADAAWHPRPHEEGHRRELVPSREGRGKTGKRSEAVPFSARLERVRLTAITHPMDSRPTASASLPRFPEWLSDAPRRRSCLLKAAPELSWHSHAPGLSDHRQRSHRTSCRKH